ncbi:hypothetical protein HHK36_023506 [Tetracentron sinense]|uniref:Uncharacterized protein n=1 Tax=Tetracentron sinense TaxID=13715 RepID=A0A835D8R8_TETSI|nr:hypothetical protein HHK36_023506 [Tetracentron sinense]
MASPWRHHRGSGASGCHKADIIFLFRDKVYPGLKGYVNLMITVPYGVAVFDARKLLSMEKNKKFPSLEDSLVLSALPKGTIPPSSPSKKGHAMLVNEKLFTLHLARVDRILRSVPSPGVGH